MPQPDNRIAPASHHLDTIAITSPITPQAPPNRLVAGLDPVGGRGVTPEVAAPHCPPLGFAYHGTPSLPAHWQPAGILCLVPCVSGPLLTAPWSAASTTHSRR